ncbi:MAG: hypothetical protein NVSMB38_43780 [Ktedonobacteraceae bacterium]
MILRLDIQMLLIIVLACLLIGVLIGAALTRPRYYSRSPRW